MIKSYEALRKFKDFSFSLGVRVGKGGVLGSVVWDSPAFKAGLTSGETLLAVNGLPYADDVLEEAIKASKSTAAPMELIVKTADRIKVIHVDYHGGLRNPHLERDAAKPDRLDDILAPRK